MKRVLIADDDYITADVFKNIIEDLGYKVIAVEHNSEEEIAQAYEFQPDVAFLDIRMDYRNAGIHASNRIKNHFPRIKVYFLSSYEKDVFNADLLKAQYDGYIDKAMFTEVIENLLS